MACPNTDNAPCLFLKDLAIACAGRISLKPASESQQPVFEPELHGVPSESPADTVFIKW